MNLVWDYSKPVDINEKLWHRKQIARYMEENPECKPKDIFTQISWHDPNPWPTYDANSIGKIMRRMRKPLSISHRTITFDVEPMLVKWNMNKPPDVHVKKWRRIQLSRYLEVFPAHKPKEVLKQLERHTINLQPDCTTHKLSQQLVCIWDCFMLVLVSAVILSSVSWEITNMQCYWKDKECCSQRVFLIKRFF